MKDIFETSEDIIKQGFSEIDKEIQDDEEVRKEAEYITKKLLSNPKVTVNYENEYAETLEERFEEYELGIRTSSTNVVLVALSLTKQRAVHEYNKTALKPKIYTPMILTAEVDDTYTYEQIINTLVSAFLCKLRGVFKVEVLEE